jgi:hypothetical protein
MATQSVRLKEEQLRREEEKLREIELKVQREINEKRQELLAKEESLRCVPVDAPRLRSFSPRSSAGTSRAGWPRRATGRTKCRRLLRRYTRLRKRRRVLCDVRA